MEVGMVDTAVMEGTVTEATESAMPAQPVYAQQPEQPAPAQPMYYQMPWGYSTPVQQPAAPAAQPTYPQPEPAQPSAAPQTYPTYHQPAEPAAAPQAYPEQETTPYHH